MSSLELSMVIMRSYYSDILKQIYEKYGNQSFTFEKIKEISPGFKVQYLKKFHNSQIIKLVDGKVRAIGRSHINKSHWVFTTEALMVLERS